MVGKPTVLTPVTMTGVVWLASASRVKDQASSSRQELAEAAWVVIRAERDLLSSEHRNPLLCSAQLW
eukprot:3234162-Amphidinium_carterae.1